MGAAALSIFSRRDRFDRRFARTAAQQGKQRAMTTYFVLAKDGEGRRTWELFASRDAALERFECLRRSGWIVRLAVPMEFYGVKAVERGDG